MDPYASDCSLAEDDYILDVEDMQFESFVRPYITEEYVDLLALGPFSRDILSCKLQTEDIEQLRKAYHVGKGLARA